MIANCTGLDSIGCFQGFSDQLERRKEGRKERRRKGERKEGREEGRERGEEGLGSSIIDSIQFDSI